MTFKLLISLEWRRTMRRLIALTSVMVLLAFVPAAFAAEKSGGASAGEVTYEQVSQAKLSTDKDDYRGKNVSVEGPFLFTGSDFCYQIRKTKINTKDYLCFAIGPVSLVRLYLKKSHDQVPSLMSVKKGSSVKAYGKFDFLGNDYKFIVVDKVEVEPPQ
jgi:hypothetical protein